MGVVKRDVTNLKADAARVGLEAILLKVTLSVAEVTDVQESTILHLVTFTFAPGTLVTQLVARPVPQAVNGFLDVTDMSCGEGGCGQGEGVSDVAAKVAIGIGAGKTAGGLEEDETVVRKLFPQVSDLPCLPGDLCACSTMADDFHAQGNVAFLFHCPVHTHGVRLLFGEEELLPPVEGSTGKFIHAGMEVSCMNWAPTPPSPEKLRTGGIPVDHDVGGDFIVLGVVGQDLEDVMDGCFLEICAPARARVNAGLWACW